MFGVNKKVIYEHEKHQIRMMLEIAEKLEKILHKKLVKEADVLGSEMKSEITKPKDSLERGVGRKLKDIGFSIGYVQSAPFDILAKDSMTAQSATKEKTLVISDVESDKRRMVRRIHALKEFVTLTNKPAVVITEKYASHALEGVPVINRAELEELDNSKELISIAKRVKK